MPTYPNAISPGSTEREAALSEAATAALRAPSIFNTQPWQWRITAGAAELRVDRSRQLPIVDPEGRLATISCGIALHHLVTALAAEGWQAEVSRIPDPAEAELLARVTLTGRVSSPDLAAVRHYESTLIRHTDRRPFSNTAVPRETVEAVRGAVEAHGAHLHVVRPDQLVELILAAGQAAEVEAADPAYREELETWTHRPAAAGDGVPAETAVADVPRRVRVRDFALDNAHRLEAGHDDDSGTVYTVLFTNGDNRRAWLESGEAMSAALLTAVEHGVSASPMSDLTEVAGTQQALRRILSGIGEPMLVIRLGISEPATAVPATPRRSPDEVIERAGEDGGK
ncbi:MAG: hypothetical protein QOJ50_591 [Cryptosporangiaceae bacterium]|nr:hypothetical protein [Cryptosporangiaceae bacterium]